MEHFEVNEEEIELIVDQSVYHDRVMGGESVRDVTVTYEIIAFQETELQYVLEGQLHFNAYLVRDEDHLLPIEHVMYDLPFVVQWPARAKQHDPLQIEVQIPEVSMMIHEKNYLSLQASMLVRGLSWRYGYEAKLGMQEVRGSRVEHEVEAEVTALPSNPESISEPSPLPNPESTKEQDTTLSWLWRTITSAQGDQSVTISFPLATSGGTTKKERYQDDDQSSKNEQ